MSAIVMRVDLDCDKCYKKIRKVLCKIQDKGSIRTISYDEKSKTVAISGPFDAEEVADRLTSSAGKVITDMHVVGGGNQKHVFNGPTKPGKIDGHGHGGYGGGGKQEKGHGGYGGGNKQEKGHGGYGSGNKQEKGHGGYGGGKPDKRHVEFDFDDMSDDEDESADWHEHHGGHGSVGKPKIVTTTTTVAARLDAPRTGPSMSMATAAPMRMPAMQPQAMAVPSIWPAPATAPEWGYSAPQYGGYPAGGSYGVPMAYGHGGYGAPAYGYDRNPYGALPRYYEEEPSAGCSIM